MGRYTRTLGLEQLKRKVLAILPQAAKDQMHKANDKSADQFVALVTRNIPVDDSLAAGKDGHLVDTLKKSDVEGGVGVRVSIGDPVHDYPLHLEGGHKTKSGGHVPPKPFWNPARHAVNKSHKARSRAALRKAVLITASGEG